MNPHGETYVEVHTVHPPEWRAACRANGCGWQGSPRPWYSEAVKDGQRHYEEAEVHTDRIEHGDETFTIHHNGDFAGDVKIIIPENDRLRVSDDRRYPDSSPTEYEVELPFAVLQEFIGRAMLARRVAALTELSGAEFLEVTT